MPSPAKAIFAIADWFGRHPGTTLLILFALVVAAGQAGMVERLDWWGTGEEIR